MRGGRRRQVLPLHGGRQTWACTHTARNLTAPSPQPHLAGMSMLPLVARVRPASGPPRLGAVVPSESASPPTASSASSLISWMRGTRTTRGPSRWERVVWIERRGRAAASASSRCFCSRAPVRPPIESARCTRLHARGSSEPLSAEETLRSKPTTVRGLGEASSAKKALAKALAKGLTSAMMET